MLTVFRRRFSSSKVSWLSYLLVGLLSLAALTWPRVSVAVRADGLAAVWNRARQAGVYTFTADVQQTVTPLATVRNVGRTSETQALHLEGLARLPDRQLQLTLWSQDGSVLNAGSGVEIKVDGDRAYARQAHTLNLGHGATPSAPSVGQEPGEWQEINNFTQAFAPQGDFMAYLAAAQDVVNAGTETRAAVTFTRYTFRIDGQGYARYLRDQMERSLAQHGTLPSGLSFDLPRSYVDMTGRGELWVDERGLPLRQILHLQFPPRSDDQEIQAQVTVDFDFDQTLAAASPLQGLGRTLSSARFTSQASLFMVSLLFCAVLVAQRRSRRLYTGLALALILAMVISPLLQSVRAAQFAADQAARSRKAETRQQETDLQRIMADAMTASEHHPNIDPLALNQQLAELEHEIRDTEYAIRAATAGDGSGGSGDADDCDPDATGDTDGDGLTDGHECVLGTHPEEEDTDGDGLTDGQEVAGFAYAGKNWYGDPNEMDTNDDGLGDETEWNTGRAEGEDPPDLDGDGTPDLFDRDNDGDGVPDRLDTSPYYAGDTVFDGDHPFQLLLDSLTEGVPTFVEFQLRPTNSDHLWYAFNVLDWPSGDDQGQLQDDDGATFFDLDDTTDRSPNDNGDVKLVPMLEIEISGEPDNLPSEEELKDYGISVQELNDDGDQVVYVPLQLIVDQKGDERVAFAGKMRYQPAAQWGNAQQVRLVWAVNMLVDVCDEYQDGRCVKHEAMNEAQIIHVYDDAWTLTGLDVREEHGTDVDVIFEDPVVDTDLDDDSMLLYLTYGLERTFLAGSDCEDIDDKGTADPDDDVCIDGDGQRDITLDEIYRRWNHATNDGVPEEKRWSLDDTFTVMTYTYGTIDEALYTLATTETKQILDDHFTAHVPVTPTLLFARDERYRGVNLDQGLNDDGTVQWSESSHRLTMVLDPDDVPVETVAGLNWAPYRYQDDTWQAYPIEDYWDELHARYTAAFADEYEDEEKPDEVRGGAVILGQIHYLSLYLGVNVTIQSGEELLTQEDYQTYDKPIWSSIAKFGSTAVVFVVNKVLMRGFYQSTQVLRALYYFMRKESFATSHELAGTAFGAIKGKFGTWWSTGHRWRAGFVGFTALVLLGLIVTGVVFLSKGYFADNPAARITAAVIVGALMLAGTIILPILQTINLVKTVQSVYNVSALNAAGRVLGRSSKFIGIAKKGAILGLVLGVGIAWGIFIYVLVKEDIPAGSVAFDMLLAQTIAATIVAILMFALTLTIVGAIIVAIISLVDIILILLGVEWTITGALTKAITKALFAYEIAVDIEDEDLVQMGRLDTAFVHPELGMVTGNEMEFGTTITTTITHRNPKDWRAQAYLWLYSENQLRSTTFKYELGHEKESLSAKLWETNRTQNWDTERDHKFRRHQMYTGWKSDDVSTVTTLHAGINRPVDLVLNTGYAIPGVECWTLYWVMPFPPFVVVIPICFNKGVDGSESTDMGGSIRLDVLPDTLDGFVDVTAWADGMRFRDADGDGLLAKAYGGNDPDDSTWDTDGDRLCDAWELDRSSVRADEGGEFFDPRNPDTDGDGLDDKQEVLAGTNPNNGDSDGDGINDASEVLDGWQFTYAEGRSVRVYSDPLQSDADRDGMNDLFERTLHTCPGCDPLQNRYHPDVWNNSPIGLYTEVGDPDGVVRPGQTFVYTTTVQNNVQPNLWVRGDTELSTDPVAFQGGPLDMYFDIARDQSQSLYSDLTVPPGTGNQDVDLNTDMIGQLHTPSVWTWDPLQVSTGATATGAPLAGVAVAAVENWTVPYVVAILEEEQVYAYAASADGLVGSGVHAIGWTGDQANAPPDVACNAEGTCLVVWSSHATPVNKDYFRWRRLVPTLQVAGDVRTMAAPAGQRTYGGAVASDGTGFMAIWVEGTALARTLKAVTIGADGTLSSSLTLDNGALGDVDVVWAYDHYLVVWERSGDLYAAQVAAQGSGFDVTRYGVADSAAYEGRPRVAYDGMGRRALMIYLREERGQRYPRARVLTEGPVGAEINLSGPFGNLVDPVYLSVSADPVNGGWVTAWARQNSRTLAYRAVGMNGELRGGRPLSQPGGRNAATDLACAPPRPVIQLALDEAVGATTFVDSSGYGNDGACVDNSHYDCPTPGVGGKEGNAVYFDGLDDEIQVSIDVSETSYAVTLWFKTTRNTAGIYEVADNWIYGGYPHHDRDVYVRNGRVCARVGLGTSNGSEKGEIICTPEAGYNDGHWHHVAHTFGGAVGAQRLYVDGALRATGTRDRSDFSGQTKVRIGYTANVGRGEELNLEGVVDQVTVYPRALSDGEVRDAYRAALLVYALDEPEGATRFENAARNGYTGSCDSAGCPTSGLQGRAYAAVEFDGQDDVITVSGPDDAVPLDNTSFTVAFWARRGADNADYVVSQGEMSIDRGFHIGFREDGRFTCAFYHDDLNTTGIYTDKTWHHWACTYDVQDGTRTIYYDGELVAQDTANAGYQGTGPLQIGRGLWGGERSFNGRLDELAVWRHAMTPSEIRTLYEKVKALDDSLTECALPRVYHPEPVEGGDNDLGLNRLAVRETTIDLGETEQEESDTVTVDGTLPGSTITSLADGQRLNVTGTLVIGGEARDNTFVTRVEVSIDGGPWETAEGAESWSYAWDTGPVGEGSHTLRSRAVDAGDNVQSPPDAVTVVIDRTPPVVSAGTPPLKAEQDGQARWYVPLSGTVSDANPDTVHVLLEGDAGLAGSGWQTATLTGGGSAWSLDYVLSAFDNAENALAEPTGVYTLSLRADDLAGNPTPAAVYPPPVRLDNTAPEMVLTYPLSDTGVLTDTTMWVTGVVTDVGNVVNGVGGVEIAWLDSEEESPTLVWQDAVLAQPGAITSTWYYSVPVNVEGFYELYARATDVLGNRNDRQATWNLWKGGIDTQTPYVDASVRYVPLGVFPNLTYRSEVTCQARDLNLRGETFQGCPCEPTTWQITTYDQVSPWYREVTSDTTHLYQIAASCQKLGQFVVPPTVSARDVGDRYSQTTMTSTLEPPPILDSAVFTPTDGTVLTTLDPFDVGGQAYALSGLQNMTVTVNGGNWLNTPYGCTLSAEWSQSYTPPEEGRYTFLSTVSDCDNDVQTVLHPITVTVDVTPPSTPTFDATVITMAHRTAGGPLFLSGVVTDAVEVRQVQVNRDGEGWLNASHDGTVWHYPWPAVEQDADGVTYTVSVRATDFVSRTSQTTETVTFDLVPPELVTVTLGYWDNGFPPVSHPVSPGQLITDGNNLTLAWTPSSDGAGVDGYRVGWSNSPTATAGLPFVLHGTAYSTTQLVGEAQTVHAHVVSLDNNANARHQTYGPVYVDAPRTPDIVDLGYHGWMESGCSLVGIDRRAGEHAMDGAALSEEQRFYTTWNSDTLRLAWEGANWDVEGDLFVYFDTQPGGATTLYNPYTATLTDTVVYLPGNVPSLDTSGWPEFEQARQSFVITPLLGLGMAADYMVRIEDGSAAALMAWNGNAWVTQSPLMSDTYRLNYSQSTYLTDLYIPFNSLGITDPTTATLNMLAVASEEDALRLWATMPPRNLVDSAQVVNPVSAGADEHVFVLTHPYRWISLGPGRCPNDPLESWTGLNYVDGDLHVEISAEPLGTSYALMADDLFGRWKALFQGQGLKSQDFDFMDRSHPPVGQGDVLTYTLTVANHGTSPATGVQALVAAYYGLHLPGGTVDLDAYREHRVFDLGSVLPGQAVTHIFTGVIEVESNWRYMQCLSNYTQAECRIMRAAAVLDGWVFDDWNPLTPTVGITVPLQPPAEWLWVDHEVDVEPPQHLGIDAPRFVVGPGLNTVRGYASDPSGVSLVELQMRDALSNTTLLSCPDATPQDGRWICPWTVSGSDGDVFDLRVRATDGYGHTSDWTGPWQTVVLDAQPPTVTLDAEVRAAVEGQLIGPEGYLLTGTFADSHGDGVVEVCRDSQGDTLCEPATMMLSTQAPTTTARLYDDVPVTEMDLAGAACGGAEITRTFDVSDSFIAADVNLGLTVLHPHRGELQVTLASPAGTRARVIYDPQAVYDRYADYDVWLDDAAPGELHNLAGDDVAEPYFDREARPDAALSAFKGEDVQGTWTLSLCDRLLAVNDGAYQRARLSLMPQNQTVAVTGTWSYGLPTPAGADGVTQTLTLYGRDHVGNRSLALAGETISLSYKVDVVDPVLTVTQMITHFEMAAPAPVLTGHVSDGGGLEEVYVRVDPPDGASYRDAVARSGGDWTYTPRPTSSGMYTLWLQAVDLVGNAVAMGPYPVEVAPLPPVEPVHRLYMPLVMRNY